MHEESQNRYLLQKDFRYLHEPVADSLSDRWVVGRSRFARELADRIILSRGGAFLVSGLRGVGKTTCVRLAMRTIRDDRERYSSLDGDFELVDVWLNLARPLEPVQLLHHLIRHLYLRLKEMNLLHRLDAELQKDLNTAFLRTSFEISSRSIFGEERGRSSEVGFGKAPWLGIEFLGKITSSHKQTRSDEDALKYLPYDEKAAEFEILSFSRRLMNGIDSRLSPLQRIMRRLGRVYRPVPRIKAVFILDELDKLDSAAHGVTGSALDPILQSLKTVFSSSSFSFVFIGGKEVEERLLEDVSHGDSIYESIFAYDLYLPCLWNEQDEILQSCFAQSTLQARSHANTVALYLRYKGRGVPRRTWRELNKHVRWEHDLPSITLDLEHRRYMQVFAKLEDAVQQDALFKLSNRTADDARRDRQRLSFYYTADWIFSRGHDSFSEDELAQIAAMLNLGGSLNAADSRQIAQSTLRLLQSRAFIERADQDLTRISSSDSANRYKLSPWVLLAFQGSSEQQWTPDETLAVERRTESLEIKQIGPFEVIEKIGSGGFGNIYKVRSPLGAVFAAKLLHAELASDYRAITLFKTESHVLKQLSHPGLVQLHDMGDQNGRLYIVMDLLEGVSLRAMLDSLKTLDAPLACRIALDVAKVCAYVHSQNLVRLDIKPANIFITNNGVVKLLDLGIIVSETAPAIGAGTTRMIIGTPGYMAPEQISGDHIGRQSDVYSLGVVLYEMLTGQTPFPIDSALESLSVVVNQEPPPLLKLLAAPQRLADAVDKSIARDHGLRLQTMEDFITAVLPFAAETSEPVLVALRSRTASREASRKDTVVRSRQPAAPVAGSYETVIMSAPTPPQSGPVPRVSRGHSFFPTNTSAPPATSTPPPQPQQFDSHPSPVPGPSLSPDPSGSKVISVPRNFILNDLRNGQAYVQEIAFTNLCASTNQPHLLFDFARNVCLWGGPNAQNRKISLPVLRLILGRDSSAVDLTLDDAAVSRQHIAFFPSPGESESFIAEDLSSATGTSLNGDRLRRQRLTDGDTLQVGSLNIAVHILPRNRTFNLSPSMSTGHGE